MISLVETANPTRTDLPPEAFAQPVASGVTRIQGPPGAGKSTLIRVALAVLTGEAPPAEQARIHIERQIGGKPVTMSLAYDAAMSRPWSVDDATHTSGAAYRGALPAWMQHPRLTRSIAEPGYWLALAHREQRDLLALACGVGDLRPTIAHLLAASGYALADDEIVDEKTADKAVKDARRALDVATGAHTTAHAGVSIDPPAAPEGDHGEAVQTIAAEDAWRAYDRAGGAAAVDDASEPPEVDLGPTQRAVTEAENTADAARSQAEASRVAHADAASARQQSTDAYRSTRADLDRARLALADVEAVPCKGGVLADVDCGACPRLASGKAEASRVPALEAQLADMERQGKAVAVTLTKAAATKTEAEARSETRTAALRAARTEHDAAILAYRARAAWLARPRPQPLIPPDVERPSPGEVAAARVIAAAHAHYPGRVEEHQRALARALQASAKADADLTAATAALARAEALQSAIRRAPSVANATILTALGDTGAWAITLGGGTHGTSDPACKATFRGRHPIDGASTGERIHADAMFRAALRRAAARHVGKPLARLPIMIDEAQSAEGLITPDLLEQLAPVWALYTTADGPLEVTRDY